MSIHQRVGQLPDFGKIYGLLESDTHELRYVGLCYVSTFAERLRGHMRDAWSNSPRRTKKLNWMRSRLRSNPDWQPEIVCLAVAPIHALPQLERELITLYREQGADLVNGTDGGDGTLGQVHTDEARQKIREKALGRVASEDTRKRLSRSRRRWYEENEVSVETRAKLSAAFKGREIAWADKVAEGMRRRWEDPEYRKATARFSEARSEAMRQRNHARKGVSLTEEQRARVAASMTPEVRAKISASLTGRKISDEERQRRRDAYKSLCESRDPTTGIKCRRVATHTGDHKNWGVGRDTIIWS